MGNTHAHAHPHGTQKANVNVNATKTVASSHVTAVTKPVVQMPSSQSASFAKSAPVVDNIEQQIRSKLLTALRAASCMHTTQSDLKRITTNLKEALRLVSHTSTHQEYTTISTKFVPVIISSASSATLFDGYNLSTHCYYDATAMKTEVINCTGEACTLISQILEAKAPASIQSSDTVEEVSIQQIRDKLLDLLNSVSQTDTSSNDTVKDIVIRNIHKVLECVHTTTTVDQFNCIQTDYIPTLLTQLGLLGKNIIYLNCRDEKG